MANIITLPHQPTTADLIAHAVDQFMTDRQNQEQENRRQADTQQGFDLQRQQLQQTGAYQQGTLEQNRKTFAAGEQDKEIESFVDNAIRPYFKSGRPEDFAIAHANVQQALAEHPDWKDRLVGYATRAASNPLPEDQANANTQKFTADQTAVAAGGSPDVQARAFTQEKALGKAMSPQQFADQQQRQPQAGPNAYPESLAIASDRAPGGTAKLNAKTGIQKTAMEQAGETQRTGMTIQAAKEKAAAASPSGNTDVKTTVSGKQYADIGSYSGNLKNQAIKHYRDSGIPALDKADAEAIKEIDNSRMNQQKILDGIEAKLPKDAQGRVIEGPENRLSQIFQTNEDLAAFSSWRAAAIQTLRATAGSKGLRINQAEIKMAVENDIPKITDTVSVAKAKVRNVNAMLDSAENATLGVKAGATSAAHPANGTTAADFLKKHGFQ